MRAADVWANHWPEEFFAAYRPLGEVYDKLGIAGQVTDLAELASAAAACGVGKVIISATQVPDTPADNRAVARAIAPHPALTLGCASVDPDSADAADEVRRAITEDNFGALKVLPFLHGVAPNDRRYEPVYQQCIELEVPVLFLTGHQALAHVPSEIGRPAHLDEVAIRFPALKIIAGPGGWPWTDELIALAQKHPNLYMHTVIAPGPMREQYLPPQLLYYINTMGRDKVMWGTGYPFMQHAQALQEVHGLGLEPGAIDAWLWGNAARMWGWE